MAASAWVRCACARARRVSACDTSVSEAAPAARRRRAESQLSAHHLLVVLVEGEHGLGPHHVHVGGDGLQQHLLFGGHELGALGLHQILGLIDGGTGAAAVVERLDDTKLGEAQGAAVVVAIVDAAAALGLGRDRGPPAGERLRHQLVGRAQLRARRLQHRDWSDRRRRARRSATAPPPARPREQARWQ